MGHSYGGMVITGVADKAAARIRRLIYWNAFVPNDGESLNDMVPPHYVGLFEQIAAEIGDGSVVMPYPIWREAFMNDADGALSQEAYDKLNPHPSIRSATRFRSPRIRPRWRRPSPTSTAPRTRRCRTA